MSASPAGDGSFIPAPVTGLSASSLVVASNLEQDQDYTIALDALGPASVVSTANFILTALGAWPCSSVGAELGIKVSEIGAKPVSFLMELQVTTPLFITWRPGPPYLKACSPPPFSPSSPPPPPPPPKDPGPEVLLSFAVTFLDYSISAVPVSASDDSQPLPLAENCEETGNGELVWG